MATTALERLGRAVGSVLPVSLQTLAPVALTYFVEAEAIHATVAVCCVRCRGTGIARVQWADGRVMHAFCTHDMAVLEMHHADQSWAVERRAAWRGALDAAMGQHGGYEVALLDIVDAYVGRGVRLALKYQGNSPFWTILEEERRLYFAMLRASPVWPTVLTWRLACYRHCGGCGRVVGEPEDDRGFAEGDVWKIQCAVGLIDVANNGMGPAFEHRRPLREMEACSGCATALCATCARSHACANPRIEAVTWQGALDDVAVGEEAARVPYDWHVPTSP